MNDGNINDRVIYGCLAIILFCVLSIVVSIAVGLFFGAGFGMLAYAIFIVFEVVCVVRAFENAGE